MSNESSNIGRVALDIVAAYVANNRLPVMDLPVLIASVQSTLAQLSSDQLQPDMSANLSVNEARIRRSITPDALISFIDGKSYKTLKRHLAAHGLTPNKYCERYGLPPDYPMVARSYSARRADISRSFSFGKHERS